jgi:twinkle protein
LWAKARGLIEFPGGEVSAWCGINGHGKSMFLSQVQLDLMVQRERVMTASFEMKPVKQMHRMSRQAYGDSQPTREYLTALHRWTDNRLWIYDQMGSVDWKKVIAVMRYAKQKFGITQYVIDSLMKCVKGEDDYNAQKNFVDELCAFAQAHNVHVHLVHHIRKGESENKMPGKFDVKGAGGITDQVDNVFIVFKNKKAIENGDGPTCLLGIEKQRHRDYEGKLGFWFEPSSQQYLETTVNPPNRYDLK